MRKRRIQHPFLLVNNKYHVIQRGSTTPEIESLLYLPVHLSRHHLYPKNRTGGEGPHSATTLKLWCYKHFFGWNNLFQFFYKENGQTIHSELTIDEIITCMIVEHPFITNKVGTPPWKALFGEKNLEEALDLLCRMLSMKLNRTFLHVVHVKIDIAIPKFKVA